MPAGMLARLNALDFQTQNVLLFSKSSLNYLTILNNDWNTCSSNENLFQYRATQSIIKTDGLLRKCNILKWYLKWYPCSMSDILRQSNSNKKIFSFVEKKSISKKKQLYFFAF